MLLSFACSRRCAEFQATIPESHAGHLGVWKTLTSGIESAGEVVLVKLQAMLGQLRVT